VYDVARAFSIIVRSHVWMIRRSRRLLRPTYRRHTSTESQGFGSHDGSGDQPRVRDAALAERALVPRGGRADAPR